MPQTTSRPSSVLITQVILICLGGLWLVGGPLFLLASLKDRAMTTVYVAFGLLMLASSVSFLVGSWGLAKRKSYGRWIGVIGLSLLLLSIFIGNAFPSSGPLASYEDKTMMVGPAAAMVASVLFYGVIVFLIYRLALGAHANAFFSGEEEAAAGS